MPKSLTARHALLVAAVASLFGCTSTEQQITTAPPAPRPEVAQGPAESRRSHETDSFADIAPAIGSAAKAERERAVGAVSPSVAVAASPRAPLPEADLEVIAAEDTERYQHLEEGAVHRVSEQPVSTFSIDVDTGAYANVRRFLRAGQLPPRDAVRVEEMINYFPYAYPPPVAGDAPFAAHTEVAPSPWDPHTHLLRIALKGHELAREALPPANLVFLIDVSGSMSDTDKLPLLKTAFRNLVGELRPRDRVSLVVYAGASGVVLEPTPGDQQARILTALERLSAGGSTHGAAGIELAYAVAQRAYIPGGINRVLLATDGDFNVGITHFERLKDLVEEKRGSGISLSTLGFGTGNYNDHLMEQLADAGNGNYSYIDTLEEGRKVLVDEFTSTMATIAQDVKIQVEFNPVAVAEYRLIGYENRALRREDFNNDRVDAGEIGAGHAVTALYEIRLAGAPGSLIDPLRYGDRTSSPAPQALQEELAMLRLRYKLPGESRSRLTETPVRRSQITASLQQASDDLRFAASVAAFGQLLRGGTHLGAPSPHGERCGGGEPDGTPAACLRARAAFDYGSVERLAAGALGVDRFGYRKRFVEMVSAARRLATPAQLGSARPEPY